MRCCEIDFIADVAACDGKVADAKFLPLIGSPYFHLEALSLPQFFRSHDNRGIFQALGQLAASSRFADPPDMAARRTQATWVALTRLALTNFVLAA